MNPETKFQTKVLKRLRAIPNSWWVKVSQKSVSGTPDILGCLDGFFVAIELKASSKSKISKLQQYEIDQIKAANGLALILYPDNFECFFKIL